MTLQQKQLLKILSALTDKTEQPFFYDPQDNHFYLTDSSKNICATKFSGQVFGMLDDLEAKNYLEYLPTYGVDYENMRLTYKGLHYRYFSFEELTNFIFKSVVIPIIVSVIAAVVTLYIKG